MRQLLFYTLCLPGALLTEACQPSLGNGQVDRSFQAVNVIDENNLNDIMLTVADPNEAVAYFQRALEDDPKRIDMQRGLAQSLIRAQRTTEAEAAWARVAAHPEARNEDRVDYADALIRQGQWEKARAVLDKVPPTHETFKRYRLEAMAADARQDWPRADSFYEVAAGLTTRPAGVLNNWGYSKLTRGDFSAAEQLFTDALRNDSTLFTAKNNLVLARGAQRKYTLPVLPLTQIERAQLLHTLGLTAVRQGDVDIAKSLLRDAIETHPQHFDEAVRALATLEAG